MKLLILSSSTGGGHDMRARAFTQWAASAQAAPLALSTSRYQALENEGALYAFGSGLYNFIQRTLPALHHIYFNVLEIVPFCGSSSTMQGRAAFQQHIRLEAPDIVLSTHDHLNHAFLTAARDAFPARPPLCGTYCGELSGGYGFSKHWVNPKVDFFIGAVEPCTAYARHLGMPLEKSWTGGFMLNPDFWGKPLPPDARDAFLRDNLQLDPRRFTLLLGTGANGANNHMALLHTFARARIHPQIIALCGRNDKARQLIEAWARQHPQIPVRALAYQAHMRRVMECADAIFARPGTGTTSEALQCGLPILFNGFGGVMPQEKITLRYCRKFFATHVVHRASALPPLVKAWMQDRATLEHTKAAIALARPRGHPLQILETLAFKANSR
ncbi:MAG: hypothetical protein LBD01_05950 [Puniceicoccales bacterium]|jgi:processive 1,2-diacylglycerol beta-glucosyltransferase|nr:hypothetical protein [Puniceicoccales bacterium]